MDNEITRADLLERVRAVAEEILEYNPDATDTDALYDAIYEQADGLVNVYTHAGIQEWLVAGMPDAEDFGGEAPHHENPEDTTARIYREASVAMYYWYADTLREELDSLIAKRDWR
jgi:hypothetical protein